MNRTLPPIVKWLLLLPICFVPQLAHASGGSCPSGKIQNTTSTLSSLGVTSCYYVAANGSDSNSGTSEASPWKHAPGMPDCSGTCSSTSIAAGEGIILRGGDTYHVDAGTNGSTDTPMGGGWNFSDAGSNGSPIYLGVDQTWSAGSSWARPIFHMDNPLSTLVASSCAYDDSNTSSIRVQGYTWVDNFEFKGKCWSQNISPGGNAYLMRCTSSSCMHITVINNYFHGWTVTSTAYDAHSAISGGAAEAAPNSGQSFNAISYNVIDGSDSSGNNPSVNCSRAVYGSPCQSGWAISSDCYQIDHNVIRYHSNVNCLNPTIVHDNLFEYNYSPINGLAVNGPHPNVMEGDEGPGGVTGSRTFYFYNNIIRHTSSGVGVWVPYDVAYIFNNITYDYNYFGNCYMESAWGNSGSSGGTSTLYFYNNTIDNGNCGVQFYGQSGNSTSYFNGSAYFANNHFIGYGSPGALSNVWMKGPQVTNVNVVDKGGNVFQAESTANSQGYTAGNNYAPTSASGATVGTGVNDSTSCGAFSPDGSLCSGTGDAASESSAGDLLYPTIAVVPRPASAAWNAGAYEFGSAASTVNPPTGLAAVVQ